MLSLILIFLYPPPSLSPSYFRTTHSYPKETWLNGDQWLQWLRGGLPAWSNGQSRGTSPVQQKWRTFPSLDWHLGCRSVLEETRIGSSVWAPSSTRGAYAGVWSRQCKQHNSPSGVGRGANSAGRETRAYGYVPEPFDTTTLRYWGKLKEYARGVK